MMQISDCRTEYVDDLVHSQWNSLKEIFYIYTKPRYLLVGSVILGSLILSHNQMLPEFAEHLWFYSCICFGGMVFFHDEIESMSIRYEADGVDGILNDCHEYLSSKYLIAKEQYEYYKDYICS